jgi:hypothetical protein
MNTYNPSDDLTSVDFQYQPVVSKKSVFSKKYLIIIGSTVIIIFCVCIVFLFTNKQTTKSISLLQNTIKKTIMNPPGNPQNNSNQNNGASNTSDTNNSSANSDINSDIVQTNSNKPLVVNTISGGKNPIVIKPGSRFPDRTISSSPNSSTNNGSNGSTGGGSSNTSNNSSGSDDTSNWNSFTNTNYGYSLKYPADWEAENPKYDSTTQSTNFHTKNQPNEVIAIFYINAIGTKTQNPNLQNMSIEQLQAQYKTKVYKTGSGNIYAYQCVPVLSSSIVQTCGKIESTITFSN